MEAISLAYRLIHLREYDQAAQVLADALIVGEEGWPDGESGADSDAPASDVQAPTLPG